MFRVKCDIQVRGNDWGVSLGAGRVIAHDQEDLGDGKTLADLFAEGCVTADHIEGPIDEAPPFIPPADEDELAAPARRSRKLRGQE